jgi:hypothetical protein
MAPGEIYLANFPFGDVAGMKLRPVLLLTGRVGPVPEVLAAYMATIIPASLLPTDILFDPSDPAHATTNLRSRTVLRLHKLATIHAASLRRCLGKLTPALQTEVSNKLRAYLNL